MQATDTRVASASDVPIIGFLPPHSLEAEQSLLGALMLSATKVPKKYTEGVVLSDRIEALFRVVF